jgi:eukaryotic-like serine/threonine-protein kinase
MTYWPSAMPCLDANEIVRFLAGDASAEFAQTVEDHVDQCGDCRALLTELGRAAPAESTSAASPASADHEGGDADLDWQTSSGAEFVDRGSCIGRYVVLDELGAGAMGVVYRAYDPELDRDVALKLVRVLGAEEGRAQARSRLLREAQAMAQLAHPNVVSVHDASIHGAHVFVAMELVEGATLDGWLKAAPRSWREIVSVFLAAGRGLAAAHAAGIVHRDVKPSNVLVGDDGRVRISDFGLATPISGGGEAAAPPAGQLGSDASTSGSDPHTRLTATGAQVGTPAYMSPEARAATATATTSVANGDTTTGPGQRQLVDAKSDQYSFAVALCEAVSGTRTLSARTPSPLRPLLRRAMATAPGDRFPSMEALLSALARARATPTRRLLAVAAVALLGVAVYAGARLAATDAAVSCTAPTQPFVGVWDPPRKAAMRAAFAATKLAFAADLESRAEQALDRLTIDWGRAHVAACEATHVRHEQSGELLDLRMACLQDIVVRVRAVTDMLVAADATVVGAALSSTDFADRLARCSNPAELRAAGPTPTDPAARARLGLATSELAHVDALSLRGRYAEAIVGAEHLVLEAQAIGSPWLEAEALGSLGEAQWRSGKPQEAAPTLHRSVAAARRARATDAEAGSLLTLVAVLGYEEARYPEALEVAQLAEAAILALGDDGRLGKLLGNRAAIYYAQRNYALAKADYQRARELLERAYGGEDRRVGQAFINLAMIEAETGHEAESLPLYGRAIDLLERALGPHHPEVALALNNRAIALANLGRIAEARDDLRRAFAIRKEALGQDHRDTIETLFVLGEVEQETGDSAAALEQFRAVLAARARDERDDHPLLAEAHGAVGRALVALGRDREAITELEQALQLWEPYKLHSPEQGQARFALARALWDTRRDRPRALELAERAAGEFGADSTESKEALSWVKARR